MFPLIVLAVVFTFMSYLAVDLTFFKGLPVGAPEAVVLAGSLILTLTSWGVVIWGFRIGLK